MLSTMEGRPKRQSATEKNYRERKRIRKEREGDQQTGDSSNNNEPQLLPDIVQEQCRQLYKAIKEYPDPDEPEYFLSTLFAQLPSKRQYPDYFEVIKNPIALSNIKTKIDQQEYKSVGDLKADIDLMVSNAKKYNIKESQVYQDAIKIHKLVKHWRPDGQDKSHSHSKKNSPKEKSSSATSSPADENKGKTVLKLPGGAFGIRQQQPPSQPQHQQLTSPPQQQHVKAIRLKAVDKQSKKRTVPLPELMDAIGRSDGKKALELLETDPAINVNELMEVEMFGDKFKWGPLHAACYYGDVKVVQALVNMGANVELNDTWYSATPLGWAAFGDKDKVARFLVEKHNANRKAKNIHNQVPFDVVTDKDDPRWIGIFKGPFPTNQHDTKSPEDRFDDQSQRFKTSESPAATITTATESPQPPAKKRRGRPPKSEKEEPRPVEEIDLSDFNAVAFLKDIFHSIQVHTDNSGRLYSEIFEDLPDRNEYPDYYNVITEPRSLNMIESNMVNCRYPTLGAWFDDIKLVFDNAMEYNEPGSRVYRDAKLLLRLVNRLKEKNFARLGIPEKQEPAVMRLPVNNVPYEADDKRRPVPKRASSKPRSQTEEIHGATPTPETNINRTPIVTAAIPMQQVPPPPVSAVPSLPPPLPQQQVQIQAAMLPTPPQPLNGPARIISRPFMNAPPNVVNILGAISTNSAQPAFPTPDFVPVAPPEMMPNSQPLMMNGQHPIHMGEDGSHLPTASPAFLELFGVDMRDLRPLKSIQLETPDKSFTAALDGHVVGHSLTVPSKVDVMTIKPVFEQPLLSEQRRISVAVLQNNGRLNMHTDPTNSGMPSFQSAPLMRGLNTIKITITANLTRAPGVMPEFKTQIYFLFVTQTW